MEESLLNGGTIWTIFIIGAVLLVLCCCCCICIFFVAVAIWIFIEIFQGGKYKGILRSDPESKGESYVHLSGQK